MHQPQPGGPQQPAHVAAVAARPQPQRRGVSAGRAREAAAGRALSFYWPAPPSLTP